MSLFFVGESTLLNFNADKIKGGTFFNFPSNLNHKNKYINLMREKIKESFLENQVSLQILLSSKTTLTKNTTEFLSEIILNTIYLMKDGTIQKISADIFTTLMQYNGAFYNLATSSLNLEQNHTDILNFLSNSFNDYARGINLLINLYSYELEYQVEIIKLIWIIGLIIFFIIYIFIYIIIVLFFRNASKKMEAYLELFFSVDENVLKLLAVNCEILLTKFKKIEKGTYIEKTEDLDESSEGKKTYKKKEKKTQKNTFNRKGTDEMKIKNNLPNNLKHFATFFALFLFISFLYFIFNALFFIDLSGKTILMCQFLYKAQKIHSYMIDIFISYRQYIFDDSLLIYKMKPFDYLIVTEKESYESLSEDIYYINQFIKTFFSKEKELIKMFNMNYCSYNYTDRFISIEDCRNKIGAIVKYDFSYIISFFIEKLRINKFLVKYLLATGTIRGNLSNYDDQNIWLKDKTIPKKEDDYKGDNIFRLDLYNNDTIHAHLDLIFVNIILPHIDIYKKYMLPYLSIDGKELYLYLTSALYLVLVIIIFFLYLYIKIKIINKQIYKTKKMLSLIPINTLTSQNIVKSLFN